MVGGQTKIVETKGFSRRPKWQLPKKSNSSPTLGVSGLTCSLPEEVRVVLLLYSLYYGTRALSLSSIPFENFELISYIFALLQS